VSGVKVCVTAPPEAIRVRRCVNVGELATGDTRVRFRAKARRSAKPRAYGLRFEASANGIDPVTATATLKIRKKA
jgi:hypothetical protein